MHNTTSGHYWDGQLPFVCNLLTRQTQPGHPPQVATVSITRLPSTTHYTTHYSCAEKMSASVICSTVMYQCGLCLQCWVGDPVNTYSVALIIKGQPANPGSHGKWLLKWCVCLCVCNCVVYKELAFKPMFSCQISSSLPVAVLCWSRGCKCTPSFSLCTPSLACNKNCNNE